MGEPLSDDIDGYAPTGVPWNPAKDPKPLWLQRGSRGDEAFDECVHEYRGDADRFQQYDYTRQETSWRYKLNGLSASQTAARMETTRNAVIGLWNRYRNRCGIAPDSLERGPQPLPSDASLVLLYKSGATLRRIAEATGYSSACCVKQRLKRLGVKKRGKA
jgi:hypothetical protein